MHQKVLILDFGSQYTQLIARRVRELHIYSEIIPFNKVPADMSAYQAVILSGSPSSVRSEEAPIPDLAQILEKLPLLGICYGAQYLAHAHGGEVAPSATREYGRARLAQIHQEDPFFAGVEVQSQVWMSHSDTIKALPANAEVLASTADVEFAAYRFNNQITYGIQFHPEVYHTEAGKLILKNFLVGICE